MSGATVTPLRRKQTALVAEREATRSFTSWKLDIIDAMMSDPRVTDKDFRIAFRVMQSVNAETRIGYISDLTICDEVPRTDRHACKKARKHIEQIGWWTVERGHGGKASRYSFSPENINAILDQRVLNKEDRDRNRAERRSRDKRRKGRVSGTPLMQVWDGSQEPRGGGSTDPGTPSLSPSEVIIIEEEGFLAESEDEALAELLSKRYGFEVSA